LPNPSGSEEDDGVVLTIANEVNEEGKESCVLIILDAKDMKELARAEVGHWHVKTVHGSFVDEAGRGVSVS
jgi:carotenoid cleavage dioxygenase-like enzyme